MVYYTEVYRIIVNALTAIKFIMLFVTLYLYNKIFDRHGFQVFRDLNDVENFTNSNIKF